MRRKRLNKGTPGPVAAILRMALPKGAEEKLAIPGLRRKWESIVGPVLGKKTMPDDLEKGVLLVKAETSSSAKALSMRAASVARAASKTAGIPVSSIRVVVGRAAPETSAGMRTRRKPARIIPAKEDVEQAFAGIKEKFSPEKEQVAKRLASLMIVYRMRFPDK